MQNRLVHHLIGTKLRCALPNYIVPAGTLRYIDVVFMLRGYVTITFEFMLECLHSPKFFNNKDFYWSSNGTGNRPLRTN